MTKDDLVVATIYFVVVYLSIDLGPILGEIAEIRYDCLTDIPWSGGAIATM